VSRGHRLLESGIVVDPPWTGSHDGGVARRRRPASAPRHSSELGGSENGVTEENDDGDSVVFDATF
jgi:hypothetical protein